MRSPFPVVSGGFAAVFAVALLLRVPASADLTNNLGIQRGASAVGRAVGSPPGSEGGGGAGAEAWMENGQAPVPPRTPPPPKSSQVSPPPFPKPPSYPPPPKYDGQRLRGAYFLGGVALVIALLNSVLILYIGVKSGVLRFQKKEGFLTDRFIEPSPSGY